jgi:hypothetical protein
MLSLWRTPLLQRLSIFETPVWKVQKRTGHLERQYDYIRSRRFILKHSKVGLTQRYCASVTEVDGLDENGN